ncbi:NADH-quinone oxidoreductase subunit K [Methylocaldum sp.]|uniref:NADH-quinone oxidoreductase subunit K n=1 Tax=Methylocaldum sp. TaxID=1969727 RepID=UPI002D377A55|nr:NADH-quinone oxidoreductase subunit K [Methylocaldum sp.]HYE35920.1 NADH-quinone oxidoreductase subunit K [Methylocaldum sp.]
MIGGGLIYAIAGAILFSLGLYGLVVHPHLMRKLIAFNITGSGVFLVLVGLPQRMAGTPPDRVSEALVLTGIVVAVSATAFGLALVRRFYDLTGKTRLPNDPRPEP